MLKWDYILWDWNGTIINDLQYNLNIINCLLVQHELSQVTKAKYKEVFSFPIKGFYEKLGFDCSSDIKYHTLCKEYFNAYERKQDNIPLMKGIEKVIAELSKANVCQIIFSSCDKNILTNQLINYPEISVHISEIIAPDSVEASGKLDLAIDWGMRNRIDWSRVLIIGDTYHEQEIAKILGSDCILLSCGHQKINKATVPTCKNILEILDMIF